MNKNLQNRKAAILKGLAHPVRLSIVEILSEGDMCVCDIADRFDLDRTTISKHLTLMRKLEILEDRKEGLHIYYTLKMKCLVSLLKCIEHVALGFDAQSVFLDCSCLEE